MAKKRKTKFERETEGKVLVPIVGKEAEFASALQEAHKIGHGALGWQGQAEMMVELGLIDVMKKEGVKFPKGKKAQVDKMRHIVIGMFMDNIYKHGEWITPEESEKRKNSQTVLYGEGEQK